MSDGVEEDDRLGVSVLIAPGSQLATVAAAVLRRARLTPKWMWASRTLHAGVVEQVGEKPRSTGTEGDAHDEEMDSVKRKSSMRGRGSGHSAATTFEAAAEAASARQPGTRRRYESPTTDMTKALSGTKMTN